ncbi:MAG: SprT family zinc-dependent metalloprotease, partial [Firmicutes bacterium]|nr:SprT family zinc-dependent metalloprotease [Bacillota bacterium]
MSHPASHEAVPLPSIEELQALYETYRQAYFDGRLPPVSDVTLEWSNRLTASAGLCKPQERIIRLSTHYHRKYPGEVGMTLLHEMIHLLVPGHGPAFRRWMEEIR